MRILSPMVMLAMVGCIGDPETEPAGFECAGGRCDSAVADDVESCVCEAGEQGCQRSWINGAISDPDGYALTGHEIGFRNACGVEVATETDERGSYQLFMLWLATEGASRGEIEITYGEQELFHQAFLYSDPVRYDLQIVEDNGVYAMARR